MIASAHYRRAYCLDCKADADYAMIDQHYQRAIALEPINVQYHAAWICYLLTRARKISVEKAWEKAAELHSNQYNVLHFPVAQLALHRAQLDFAELVLGSIPETERVGNLAILWNELQVMFLADKSLWSGDAALIENAPGYLQLPPIYPDPMRYLRAWAKKAQIHE